MSQKLPTIMQFQTVYADLNVHKYYNNRIWYSVTLNCWQLTEQQQQQQQSIEKPASFSFPYSEFALKYFVIKFVFIFVCFCLPHTKYFNLNFHANFTWNLYKFWLKKGNQKLQKKLLEY